LSADIVGGLAMEKISKQNSKPELVQGCPYLYEKFQEYFKIGVSGDFILLRDDFPMKSISPSDFSRLCSEAFKRNDEALHGK
jgi:hypothetical protein